MFIYLKKFIGDEVVLGSFKGFVETVCRGLNFVFSVE